MFAGRLSRGRHPLRVFSPAVCAPCVVLGAGVNVWMSGQGPRQMHAREMSC